MASDRDQWADELSGESSGGWLTGFLADEDKFDRRSLWRLGWWGAGSIAAVVGALFVNHASVGWRREQMASADLMRQAQQIQWIAKESQNETRRLASAIDTLNSDRDRLYSRVTELEQGLDSVTGSIGRQSATAAPPDSLTSGPPISNPVPSPTVSQTSAPPSASAPANVAQNGAQPAATMASKGASKAAALTTTASATSAPAAAGEKTGVAALQLDASAAAAPPQSATDASLVRAETTSNASSAGIKAPAAAATGPATAAPATTAAVPGIPAAAAKPNSTPATEIAAATVNSAPAPDAVTSATAASGTPPAPLMPAKSILAPPDPAAAKLMEPEPAGSMLPVLPPPQSVASAPGMTEPDAAETQGGVAVQRTEFGIDLGGANSIDGLRALWRGLLKYRSNKVLAGLRPIIVVKERGNGLGMQLRLVAGPISDAAAAAKICAALTESDRSCETTVFDGQRLALKDDHGPATASPGPASNGRAGTPTRSIRRHSSSNAAKTEEPEKPPPPKPTLSSLLGLR